MAYSDTHNRPNPALFGGALIVNGLLIAGIIFAAPHITKDIGDGPTRIIDFFTPPPSKPTPVIEVPKPNIGAVANRPTVPPTPETRQQSETLIPADTGLIPIPPLPPLITGGGTISTLSPVHNPVLTSAKINPRYANDLQPIYPPGLIRQEIEGSVTVRVLVGIDGRVKAVEPLRFDDDAFVRATRDQALRKWRFLPATRDGAPFESWREMTVRFEMPD